MHINIAERLKPYSHTPGIYLILPKTNLRFQIFPSLLVANDLSQSNSNPINKVTLNIQGPVKDFTAMLDLEKHCITVWGNATNGFFRYNIVSQTTTGFEIIWDKKPEGVEFSSYQRNFQKSSEFPNANDSKLETLSLGNNKAQNLDQIRSRCDLKEIFPLWYKLGQLTPKPLNLTNNGTTNLLEECKRAILAPTIINIVPAFRNLYLAGFDAGFSPRLEDSEHQGFNLPQIPKDELSSAIQIFTEGFKLIREIFISEAKNGISILPALPPEFHCGRLKNIITKFGEIDIEWSKKTIRRMVMKVDVTQNLLIHLQHDIRTYRVRHVENEKGNFYTKETPILLEAGKKYLFDCFEK
jgi:hypothetical protein